MPPSSKARSVTFTGCWTCKARKVRCDERPLECSNCERRGVICGGYDIRLQWISDPFAQDDISTGLGKKGRRRIMLDKGNTDRYGLEEVDDLLCALDHDARTGMSSRKGPFSVFLACIGTHKSMESPSSPSDVSPMVQENEQPQNGGISDEHAISSPADYVEPTWIDSSLVSDSQPAITPHEPSVDDIAKVVETPNNLSALEGDIRLEVDTDASLPNSTSRAGQSVSVDQSALSRVDMDAPEYSTTTESTTAPNFAELDLLSMQQIQITLFGDTKTDVLMHHYMVRIADLLRPVLHPNNLYRGLYVPTALEGAFLYLSNPSELTTGNAHLALYHAILAIAAFHLWNCDAAQKGYQRMGVQHKHCALQHLQAAINASTCKGDYRTIMMAMLSLVTMGIISDDHQDLTLHLNATAQLRNSRKRWRTISSSTRQLNQISAFLALMSRSMSFQVDGLALLYENDENDLLDNLTIQSGTCYEYMYGITPDIAAAIQETCRLAELVARFGHDNNPIPETLLEGCEALGDRLLRWEFDSETVTSIPAGCGVMSTVFEHQVKAWHCAALIYYYRRIQRYQNVDLIEEVECVAAHMHAAEDAKSASMPTGAGPTAPITWPMFIASCETVPWRRESCIRWWERVQHYGIANIKRQWEIIQQIWAKEDAQEEGTTGASWIDILSELGTSVLPV